MAFSYGEYNSCYIQGRGEVQLAGYLEQTNLVTSHVTSQITSTVVKAPARTKSSEQNFFLFV